ncbi:MAG: hypothetical protein IJH61_05245, partial [Eubacteriaceae bacterium]|nr:hypothetical protein [Eubacteriaceae bacterium]
MKKLFSISFFILLLAAFLFSPTIMASEKTVYIDQTKGNDENNGSASAPFQSMSKALSSSEGNDDLIIILDNCYTLNDSQTFNAPLKEDGTPRAVTIEPSASGYFSIGGGNNAKIVFKDITFDGSQSVERSNSVFSMTSGTLTLDNVNIRNICESNKDNISLIQDGSFAQIAGGTLKMINAGTVRNCFGKNGIFYVNPQGTMTISDDTSHPIVFSECHSSAGGAIYNVGTLSVDHADFQSNIADNSGGAIFNNGMATIRNTNFDDNSSNEGGAIYNYSTSTNKVISIDISHCRFTNNSSENYGGAVNNYGTFNGDSLTFSDNTSESYGGAVSNHGTFNGSALTFESNTAPKGSAIYVGNNIITDQYNRKSEKSVVNLTDCATANNQSILTDSIQLTFCGGTYQGPIQIGTKANYVTVKKSSTSEDTVITNLNLGYGQHIKYGGGFTENCHVDFSKPEEYLSIPELIVQETFENPDLINTFHLKNDNYKLAFAFSKSNKSLKAVLKVENKTTPHPSIHYANETMGVDTAMEWKTNDESSAWQPCQKDMPLSEFGWGGTKAVDIFVRYAATNDLKPSAEVSLTIPARPEAPTGLTPHD